MRSVDRLLLALFACTGAAHAADWQMFSPAGHAPRRVVWLVDRASVQPVERGKRAWIDMINETVDEKNIKSMKMLVQLDCSGGRSRPLAILMIGPKGMLGDKETPGDWSYIAPETPMEVLSHAICAGAYEGTIAIKGATADVLAQAAFDTMGDNGHLKRR